jgi:proline dehydrogenase
MLRNSKRLEKLARKFICVNRIEAINRAIQLKEEGIYSTINHTVEHVDGYALAGSAIMAACDLLFSIRQWELEEYTSVSIKMSALGMDFDKTFCEANILHIRKLAYDLGIIVQWDVEGPETHEFYYQMVNKHVLNGALQARSWPFLFEGVHRLPIKPPRLVKGAYKTKTKRSAEQIKLIILHWIMHYLTFSGEVIVGTHDPKIISGLPPSSKVELQYLHGVKEKEFREYKKMGFKVREYIPYGEDWYPYLIRRIKENPWGKIKLFFGSAA